MGIDSAKSCISELFGRFGIIRKVVDGIIFWHNMVVPVKALSRWLILCWPAASSGLFGKFYPKAGVDIDKWWVDGFSAKVLHDRILGNVHGFPHLYHFAILNEQRTLVDDLGRGYIDLGIGECHVIVVFLCFDTVVYWKVILCQQRNTAHEEKQR